MVEKIRRFVVRTVVKHVVSLTVVFVEVITVLPSPEMAGAKTASPGGAVGMGFFLLFGVFFLGTLLALTVFHSSGIV